ncbi:unnamed protein product [Rotaria socialis]|uniref:Uncharacterized protein n=1 Tax=Rotaria socialis TaxID=392032 RepID=A0A817YXP7_9BILA|nr:unnamed protein product [Rotaria socialis]CAF3471722.1 unnamed protein product [Rotaria socialis]CAF4289131.1 unnamed protein product [Rotaria socialis]CAF4322470.1 unnamed protein product [Rotaria socialis]CAF4447682.1 unnamed protein product [Rotaria socialis]
MCMKVDCAECGKPTWKGCGKHIEQALNGIAVDERCKCSKDSCISKPGPVEEKEEKPSTVVESNMEKKEEEEEHND